MAWASSTVDPLGGEAEGDELGGFPALTFVELTVADDRVHAVAPPLSAQPVGDAGDRRDALAHGAGGHLHPGDHDPVGVRRQSGADRKPMSTAFGANG